MRAESLVRYHISNGINPNYPLVAGVIQGHAEIALYLLENGAQIDLVSSFEEMAALQAVRR